MWLAVIISSLVAAFLNALGSVVQRRATGQIDVKRLFHHHIVAEAFHSRLWLLGGLATVGAFGFQALALQFGSLIVVEPLLTTDLVFLMLILYGYFKTKIGRREWGGAVAVSVGLSLLLVTADPHGGNAPIKPLGWLVAIAIVGVLVVSAAYVVRRGPSPHWRATVTGLAAGAHFALTGGLVKLCIQQLQFGVVHEFASWPVWALAVVGSTSLISMQSMYGAGPLAISWPLAEIVEAVGGIIIGLAIFGDTINTHSLALLLEITGFTILVTGIVLLTGSSRLRNNEQL